MAWGNSLNQDMIQGDGEISIGQMKEVSYGDFVNFAIFQVLKAQLDADVFKFPLAVENLESLLLDEVETFKGKSSGDNYDSLVNKIKDGLESEAGRDDKLAVMKNLAKAKFRMLLRMVKKKLPVEEEGIL